jgi:cytochrome c biogenesis protein CcdA/thiol-disulfide isomerase/thioredoxin
LIALVLIGLVGGMITGISPCILPVLPVVFLSSGVRRPDSPEPKRQSAAQRRRQARAAARRPFLVVAGLALSFSVFTLLGTLVLKALPLPADIIRWAGLAVLVLLGIGLIWPRVESLLERPFAAIPQRGVRADRNGFLLGLALGAVYVPCAGPVLAAITVAGATGRIGGRTLVLTVAFAAGTALPLLMFALAGRTVTERVRAFRRHQRGIRVSAGVVMVGLAVALTFNVTDAVQRAIPDYTSGLNNALNAAGTVRHALAPADHAALDACAQNPDTSGLADCGPAPAIAGISQWFNTPGNVPLSLESLRGKVVLVDFWAYSCINCQRAIAHVDAWYAAYRAAGLVVIGVHTPEYSFEHVPSNVEAGAKRLGIGYPVALDNGYTTWNNFDNQSWPADYLIDATGTVRHVGIGEGEYQLTESLIRDLLAAADPKATLPPATQVADQTPTALNQTGETYLGAARADSFAGDAPLSPGTATFVPPTSLPPDEFALAGTWQVTDESITAQSTGAAITLDFVADDVYLDVGGTGTVAVTVDGATTTLPISGAPNIYTVFHGDQQKHTTLRVTLTPGLSAYSFTFG